MVLLNVNDDIGTRHWQRLNNSTLDGDKIGDRDNDQ